MPERVGDLAIVLHSHMPYVEGFGTYPFGEEWLFDAVLRSYLPVLDVAERLTMTVTPVLADQLEAPGVAERLAGFARRHRLEACEADAREVDPAHAPACRAEAERYRRGLERLRALDGDLLAIFREPGAAGRVELVASAATHAVLPLLATVPGRRLQLDVGLRSHRRRFGRPSGFWLPECAYDPGLETLLAERDLRFFCVDQSGHDGGVEALAPVATAAGPVAFAIDWEAVSWLWSLDGYPADPVHADFYRQTMRGAHAWAIGGGAYDPEVAAERAREQAAEFVRDASTRLGDFHRRRDRHGLMVFAIDTELLGHWWQEGPVWLAEVLRRAAGAGIETLTLSEALARHSPSERPLGRGSWGEGKDLRTWDSPPVADLARASRRLELRLLRALLADELSGERAQRAARELLALQSSDWAFLDGRRQASDYPFQRVTAHAGALLEAIHSGRGARASGDRTELDARLRNLAPDLSLAPLREP
jgi:1,4-alpha-glucan branching enzyme